MVEEVWMEGLSTTISYLGHVNKGARTLALPVTELERTFIMMRGRRRSRWSTWPRKLWPQGPALTLKLFCNLSSLQVQLVPFGRMHRLMNYAVSRMSQMSLSPMSPHRQHTLILIPLRMSSSLSPCHFPLSMILTRSTTVPTLSASGNAPTSSSKIKV